MNKKKLLALIVAVAMVLTFAVSCGPAAPPAGSSPAAPPAGSSPAAPPAGGSSAAAPEAKHIGFYADAADSYYSLMNDALQALAKQDKDVNWTVDYKVGSSTADEQLKAVQDFITSGYDAIIVIQNNPTTTGQCIQLCKDAGIPYFGACHDFSGVPNAKDSAGSTAYDFVAGGEAAGQDALARGITKVIMIEGVLGQGSAAAQSLGFLQAYEKAGKSLGDKADGSKWTAKDIAEQKPAVGDIKGKPDVQIVSWNSGNWMTEPAQKAMQDAITSLGATGWDGAYVQNNPMVEGAINAMKDQGLSTDKYWLGSMNGREMSWQWAKDGVISMDVNQPSTMEGALIYQMIKEYFANGSVAKAHVHPYITPYTKENIAQLEPTLVPMTNVDNFIAGVNGNKFVWKIDDPKFVEIASFK